MKDNSINKKQLIESYQNTRRQTERLCEPLVIEDYVIQSIEDVSPPKWHLAHTTWFYETFILMRQSSEYELFHPTFSHLFNSYYHAMGEPFPRIKRGLLSRPTVETIYAYRHYVDKKIMEQMDQADEVTWTSMAALLTLGLHHEQQHQELLLMDIKHNFSIHPAFPVYQKSREHVSTHSTSNHQWTTMGGGMIEVGHQGKTFCFDNELPRHRLLLNSYAIANRLVTNREYLEFIEANAYQAPTWWLSDGWDCVQRHQWQAPLYWHKIDNEWFIFTLNGLCKLNLEEPVSHVSYYEADAYARWRQLRLPTEAEWEYYAAHSNVDRKQGVFLESHHFHPQAAKSNDALPQQVLGDVWEWTSSSYCPYPGYKPLSGALGEYNGKFMSNQMVLRGGSCVTPQSHVRLSYRNFFQPDKRWQFSGIRLAKDS